MDPHVVAESDPRTRAPVFIVGPLRSGTTMLRLMLDHHPQINIFGEFEYPVMHADHCAQDADWPTVSAYCDWLETNRMFCDARVTLRRDLSYPDLVRNFFSQHAAMTEKAIVGATVHSRFDLIAKLWPKARFIHTVRDPRDVAGSAVAQGWTGHVYFGAKFWLEPELRWEALDDVPPEQKIEVRYEELVRNPQAELARLCTFLGLAYDSAMLTYDQRSTYAPPDPSLIQRWRREMPPRDARLVDGVCGELLVRRGYGLSGPTLVPSFIGLLALRLRSRVSMTRFAVKRLGLALWLRRFLGARLGSREYKRQLRLELNEVERRHLK